jgi:uncharacterized protein
MNAILQFPSQMISAGLIAAVKVYQFVISPWIPANTCRFEPSCSHYFILAVQKHGPVNGTAQGVWRVCRCNPWGGHGADLP